LLTLISLPAWASGHKIDIAAGYFSIDATVEGESAKISNPSVLYLGYLRPLLDELEFKIGYTVLMSDFSGSDLGYGLNVGANYFPTSSSLEENFKSKNVEVTRYEELKPFLSAGFFQRSFQSVKMSYAGFGVGGGVEKYYNKKINLKAELRYTALSGNADSKATEVDLLIGIVYKL
jgi:opacity protein-like surface antigen